MHTYLHACMDGWMDGSTVHAQGTPSYTVNGPEAGFFFLVCLFATTTEVHLSVPVSPALVVY